MSEEDVRQGFGAGCLLQFGVALLLFVPFWGVLTMSFAQLSGQLEGWRDLSQQARLLYAAKAAFPLTAGAFALVWAMNRVFSSTSRLLNSRSERLARDRYQALSEGEDQLPPWSDERNE